MNTEHTDGLAEQRTMQAEEETMYLLRSETMKRRLLEAIARDGEGAKQLDLEATLTSLLSPEESGLCD